MFDPLSNPATPLETQMSRPPRPRFPHAYPRPWKARQVNGYIGLFTTVEPIQEACLVAINGAQIQAEHTAALIEFWSAQDAAGRSVRS
jgi:hypothetical protein